MPALIGHTAGFCGLYCTYGRAMKSACIKRFIATLQIHRKLWLLGAYYLLSAYFLPVLTYGLLSACAKKMLVNIDAFVCALPCWKWTPIDRFDDNWTSINHWIVVLEIRSYGREGF